MFFSALTMSEPMSGGLRELCLYDNERERKSRRDRVREEGRGQYVFLNEQLKAETVQQSYTVSQ